MGDIESPFVSAEHDPVGADIVAQTGHLTCRTDVVHAGERHSTTLGEVDPAFQVDHKIVGAVQWLAVEVADQDPTFRDEKADGDVVPLAGEEAAL